MLAWMTENAGTILVALVLAGTVGAVIRKLIRDRRRGKTSCGCGCEHCAMSGSCHKS